MYNTIQNILTALFEAIAIIGFGRIVIQAMWISTQKEILSWGTPQAIPNPNQKRTLEAEGTQPEALTNFTEMPRVINSGESEIMTSTKEIQVEKNQKTKPSSSLNNRLYISLTCWQVLANVTKLLDSVKASELKAFAAEKKIKSYRKLNKTQLFITLAAN